MRPSILEKIIFTVSVVILYLRCEGALQVLAFGLIDPLWGFCSSRPTSGRAECASA
jgi:hypothetical protein